MNSNEKFEQIYSKIVENNIDDLELSREGAKKETIRNGIITTIVIGIGIAMYFILYNVFYPNDEISRLFEYLYIGIAIIVYIKKKPKGRISKIAQYKDDFKSIVIKALLDSFNENIKYSPYSGISSTIYNEAEFEKYNTYKSEDLMQGRLRNNCDFSMAEVLTEYRTIDSDGCTHYHTLFCGIVSKVETPKPFNASLYLRKDRKDKDLLSRAFRAKLPFDDLRIEMDSQEFEKFFDVYTSNQIIAMQLLTADIMQLLIDFQKEMNMEYELTIKNNCIYIRFMSGEMFEIANVTKFSLDKPTLYKYYRMLDFTFSLTDKLINLIKDTEYNLDICETK